MAIQVVEPAFPLAAKRLYPIGNILESDGYQLPRPSLRVTPAFDEPRVLQDLEVL